MAGIPRIGAIIVSVSLTSEKGHFTWGDENGPFLVSEKSRYRDHRKTVLAPVNIQTCQKVRVNTSQQVSLPRPYSG
jgi:hypothetical protein